MYRYNVVLVYFKAMKKIIYISMSIFNLAFPVYIFIPDYIKINVKSIQNLKKTKKNNIFTIFDTLDIKIFFLFKTLSKFQLFTARSFPCLFRKQSTSMLSLILDLVNSRALLPQMAKELLI